MKSAGFNGHESRHESLNTSEFVKLLLASHIFSLAILFAILFPYKIVIISGTQNIQLFCELRLNNCSSNKWF